jgi:hypothetical protein
MNLNDLANVGQIVGAIGVMITFRMASSMRQKN